jgi:hypothetical protein
MSAVATRRNDSGIGRRHAEEERLHRIGRNESQRTARSDTDRRAQERLLDHHQDDYGCPGAQSHPDADFFPAPSHVARDDAKDADAAEQQRHTRERRQQERREAV